MRRPQLRTVSAFALSLACLLAQAQALAAESAIPRVVCREGLAETRRAELAAQLRAITGWPELRFDEAGALRLGAARPSGGSEAARALLTAARDGAHLIVIEDASGSEEVAFCRVTEGAWKGGRKGRPAAYVLQVDFTDFSHVTGDREARAAFNAGWAVLHEIDHVVHDSVDPSGPGAAGECEEAINRMRRECGLAERAEYFYTPAAEARRGDFKTRLVRLAFQRTDGQGKQPRRYWLLWDAELVGGLPAVNQLAGR